MLAQKILCVMTGTRAGPVESSLRAAGWDVVTATDIAGARKALARTRSPFCLLMLDHVNAAVGAEIESCIRASGTPDWVAVIPPRALEAPYLRDLILNYFFDYHTDPVAPEVLVQALAHAYRRASLRAEHERGASAVHPDVMGMVGQSAAMNGLRRQIQKVAGTNAPILIGGESGSGKELAAQAIHRCSERAGGPFVAVNCGAIAPSLIHTELFGHERGAFTGALSGKRGLIEMAGGGTLFLDEIGDLPLELQTNLLRFLQERTIHRVGASSSLQVDARVVAASHVDLGEAVACGKFREDLYYRLNVLSISVPPLRERKEDLPVLAQHIYRRCAAERKCPAEGFSQEASAAMLAHDWPGNVRELFNRVQRAVVMTDRRLITAADLELCDAQSPVRLALAAVRTTAERDAISITLNRVGRNVTVAARELGVSRMTLYRLMEKHRIASGAG